MAFPLATQGFLNSIFFPTYETVKRRLDAGKGLGEHDISYFNVGVAGGVGGGLQAFPCTAIEFAKVKLQDQTGTGRWLSLHLTLTQFTRIILDLIA